jgi:hypothetical protein
MRVDRRNFLVFGSVGLVALSTAKAAVAELPALLRGKTLSSSPAKAIFARAFNLWMDQAARHEQEWSHELDDVTLFRKQLSLGIKPTHGAGAAAHLLECMDLGNTSVLPIAARKIDGAAVTPAEAVFGRAFNLWMYETVRHPERSSHEADDVAAFRKQSAMGIEPRYGVRAAENLLHFLEQAQVAA